MIYPVDSAIHRLNNWGLVCTCFEVNKHDEQLSLYKSLVGHAKVSICLQTDGLLRFSLSLGLWLKPAFIYICFVNPGTQGQNKIHHHVDHNNWFHCPAHNTCIVLRIYYLKINYFRALWSSRTRNENIDIIYFKLNKRSYSGLRETHLCLFTRWDQLLFAC